MADSEASSQQTTAHYRSPDPVSNLRVRVVVSRVEGPTAPAGAPAGGAGEEGAGAAAEGAAAGGAASAESLVVEGVFAWQQKVFSVAEAARRRAEVPVTDLDRKYSAMLAEGGAVGAPLYTYVDVDEFNAEGAAVHELTTSKAPVRRAAGAAAQQEALRKKQQRMYIAFKPHDAAPETIIATFTAHPDGSLDARPAFTTPGGAASHIELPDGSTYEYEVYNTADRDATALEQRSRSLADHAASRAVLLRRAAAEAVDVLPPPGPSKTAMRLNMCLEIVAARGCRGRSLYVEYWVDANPEVWKLQKPPQAEGAPDPLRGVTHLCTTMTYPVPDEERSLFGNREMVAHFGHPVEFELVAQHEVLPRDWPVVYFQIASYDRWDRFCVEGYGYLPLHGEAVGHRTHRITTWRPLGSVRDRMRTFFIGGSAEIEDITYLRAPDGFRGPVLSRFGMSSETGGELKVRTNGLVQMSQSRIEPTMKRVQEHVKRTLQASAQKVARKPLPAPEVMEQGLRRARRRVEEARERERLGERPDAERRRERAPAPRSPPREREPARLR